MTAAPTTAAATKPAARPAQVTCPSPACMACKSLGNLSSPAPKMMGVDMRKLKRAISSRVKPWKSPSEMVAPLRDTPGTSAAACATPRPKARPTVISSRWRVLRPARSAIQRMVRRAASVAAMRSGARKFASAQRSSSLPATAPGMAETTIPQKSRRSVSLPRRKRPAEMSRIQSFQKMIKTAASVPQCSATSKASPGSSQPKTQGMSVRWALDEMGRNSASPCTMPRMTACQVGIAPVLRSLVPARQVLFLRGRQLVDLHTHGLELEPGDLLVDLLRHRVDLLLQLLRVLHHELGA